MLKRVLAVLLLSLLLVQAAGAEDQASVYRLVNEEYKIYELGDTGWLIEHWADRYRPENTKIQAQSFNEVMSAFDSVKTYVYLINSSRTMDMNHPDSEPAVWKLIQEYFPNSTLGSFRINSLEEYKAYFYKTDHHWNYRASYKGYTQIIRMLLGNDEPLLKPVETVKFPVMYNGSYNRYMKVETSDEPFTVYRFNYPKMSVKINNKSRKSYGRQDDYFAGKYSKKKLTNHYSAFYGGDEGLVEFNANQPDKENILIFSNSFSDAINKLIASHFNHTYFVDMRHYSEDLGEPFDLAKFIKTRNVTKVLLLGDGHFFGRATTY